MKKIVCLIAFIVLLFPFVVKANIMCSDGTESPSCTTCHQGCCSHHGGCASNYSDNRNQTHLTDEYNDEEYEDFDEDDEYIDEEYEYFDEDEDYVDDESEKNGLIAMTTLGSIGVICYSFYQGSKKNLKR